MTIHYIDDHLKHTQDTPGCTGPCEQGRRLCPCPTACGIATQDDDYTLTHAGRFWLVYVLIFVCAALAVFY